MEISVVSTNWDYREKLFVAACLLIMGAIMWRSIHFLSPTFDEPVHTISGIAHWQKQDTRLNPEHPPLMKILAALPLVFEVHPDYKSQYFCSGGSCEWLFTRTQFENEQLQDRITHARIPMILITLLTGWVLYCAARRIGGIHGAVLALVVYVTSPFFLGYGSLVVNDILVAMMSLLVCMAATDAVLRPGRKTILLMALALAGAWVAKFSALAILPSLILAWLMERKRASQEEPPSLVHRSWTYAIVISFVITYVFYYLTCGGTTATFVLKGRQMEWQQFLGLFSISNAFVKLWENYPWLEMILRPLWLYITGGLSVLGRNNSVGYVFGAPTGLDSWIYFPIGFLFKMPLTLLGPLVAVAVFSILQWWQSKKTKTVSVQAYGPAMLVRIMLVLGACFTLLLMFSRNHIGVRHISVTILICHVLVALLPQQLRELSPEFTSRVTYILATLLAAAGLWMAYTAFPNYISYFNPLRGQTPKQEIINDSNVEWGEGFIRLAEYQKTNNLQHMYVSLNTQVNPQIYIPTAKEWDCAKPIPSDAEWLAISASYMLWNNHSCRYLYQLPFIKLQEESIYLFKVTDRSLKY